LKKSRYILAPYLLAAIGSYFVNCYLHQATNEKSPFMFFENWNSIKDLEKHRKTPRLKALRQKAVSLPARPIEVKLSEMISEA